MEFSAYSRRLGPGHPRAETTVGKVGQQLDVPPGQQDARALEAGVSPTSPCGRSTPCTFVSRGGASTKVSRLQAALTSLGPNDHGERAVLEVSLRKAQQQATVPPVAERAEQIESEDTVVQCRGVGPMGSRMENRVRQRVARSRVAFGKAPCRGHRTDGLPRTHETQQARHSGSTPVGSGERTVMGS